MQQCRELLAAQDLWAQAEAAAPGAAAELKQLTGILAGIEAHSLPWPLHYPDAAGELDPDPIVMSALHLTNPAASPFSL